MFFKSDFNLEEVAGILASVAEKTVKQKSDTILLDRLAIYKKNITEYEGKMMVCGIDVFNAPAYVSAQSCYPTDSAMEKHKAIGACVFYLLKDTADEFLRALGYRDYDDEDSGSVAETIGIFCSAVLSNFQKELVSVGYKELIWSQVFSILSSSAVGVDFNKDEYVGYQIDFNIKGKKAFAADITMASVPRK